MSFIDSVERARALLERLHRISLRALQRELDLEDDALDELVHELVEVQQFAIRDAQVLAWIGSALAVAAAARQGTGTAVVPSGMAAGAHAVAAERRQLTVMFCDLVGSTSLSERLDPEDLREVIGSYQRVCAQVVERFDGYLAKYLGDGVLVYFGYPQAHEDDAERAVRAGLAMIEEVGGLNTGLGESHGVRLALRVGIHTGLVVAGSMGADRRCESQAIVGEAPNVAARLQEIAAPDSVVVSNATLRLTPGLFLTQELGKRRLRGLSDPVAVYRVLRSSGVRSRLDVAARLTPFVGRQQEVGLLLDRWEQVQEGAGQAVLISGEAGVGKSRLVQSLRQRVTDTSHTWLECRCSPYTQNSAFYPVIDLLKRTWGLAGDDPAADKMRTLERNLSEAGLDPSASGPLFAMLLSLPLPERHAAADLSPELRRQRTLEFVVALLLGLTEHQPAMLLVEDVHWCDPSTLEVVGMLLDQAPRARLLLLLTFRPDFQPPWPARSHLTPIHVGRLRRRQAQEMASLVAVGRPLAAQLAREIAARADDVPLFIEELTRTVLESEALVERDGEYALSEPLSALSIPATLQDLLTARLDRLSAAREVLQLAATLGREFPYALLRAVWRQDEVALRQRLAQLVDAEVLYQHGLPPDATYTFKHSLLQETAYHSLLRRSRREMHARIAEVLERQFAERVVSEPEVIARHYEEAGLAPQAIRYYQWAGEQAAERSAHHEAIGHLRRAIALIDTLPESAERHERELPVRVALGASLQAAEGFSSPAVRDTYQRIRALCGLASDPDRLALALWGLRTFHLTSGDLQAAHELSRTLRFLGDEKDESVYRAAGEYGMGSVAYYQGQCKAALQHSEQAVVFYDAARSREIIAGYALDFGIGARCYMALASWHLGYPDRALRFADDAVVQARCLGHPLTLGFTLVFAAIAQKNCGNRRCVEQLSGEAISLSEQYGFRLFLGGAMLLRGWSLAGAAAAVREVEAGLSIAGHTGNQTFTPLILGGVAEVYQAGGRLAEALAAVDAGLAYSAEHGMVFWDAELLRQRGELLLAQGSGATGEPELLFRKAMEVARVQEARSHELRAAVSLARLLRSREENREAAALLQAVYRSFTEGLATEDLRRAAALLAELSPA